MNEDERLRHVLEVKQKLNLGFIMDRSAKRSVIRGELRTDMPCLEFNRLDRRIYNDYLFEPHEMQWSINDYVKNDKMLQMGEEGNKRMLDRINQAQAKLDQIKLQGEETGIFASEEGIAKRGIRSSIEELSEKADPQGEKLDVV
eukprot:CAMPEP_0116876958 /NCGR_PEP_ID=MMETSP0463-20121206/8803_1 /TAXON_ID=181622 /ORGANISM="Strombidinopsis sp, Strain SopsisLIS2011" /LENGTH=143 /DNA_ID=CAMNT_0004523889 /DNA_START=175 /DNA_END=606 /DNA_ORIENTATION=-